MASAEYLRHFREIIDDMVYDELHRLKYALSDRQYDAHERFVGDNLKKLLSETDVMKELTNIRDVIVKEIKDGGRFSIRISRLKEEGYSPDFFDSRYIDFSAHYGKLDNIDVEYKIDLKLEKFAPEVRKDEDLIRYMKMFWNDAVYITVHENGECAVIFSGACSGPADTKYFYETFPWIENINLTRMCESDVANFFDRNKDIPVKYHF